MRTSGCARPSTSATTPPPTSTTCELAAAYLEGADALPRDLALASHHLVEVFRYRPGRPVLAEIDTRIDADALLARLPPDAHDVLATALAGDRTARLADLTARVARLREVGAPDKLIELEEARLRDASRMD
jgi:hypothetical protein